jgi:Flp pilus assembly protein protease CpaA
MTITFLIISFLFLNGFLPIFLFYDLKYRRVPLVLFKFCYLIAVILNVFEYFLFFKHLYLFIFFKILIIFFVLFLSLILFLLRIVGGSDGKLLVLIFLVHPLLFLNFTIILIFFLIFSLFFVSIFTINLIINNSLKKSFSFFLIFNSDSKISVIKKSFIKGFYRFFNFSELGDYMEKKSLIKSLNLVYNVKINKFQILCQIRPPLIIIIMLSYYVIFYFILTI